MPQKKAILRLLRTSYSNKRGLGLLVIFFFLLFINALEYRTFSSSQHYYHQLIKSLEETKESISPKKLQEIQATNERDSSLLRCLSHLLLHYQIKQPETPGPITPVFFQEKLQRDVLAITEQAQKKQIKLPSSFFLGFSEYRYIPIKEENLSIGIKQETVINWIVSKIVSHHQLILNELTVTNKSFFTQFSKHISASLLGYITINITTEENSFQQILNEILQGPYYLVITKIAVENSNKKSPLRTPENMKSDIQIIFGREKITTTITLELFDFELT